MLGRLVAAICLLYQRTPFFVAGLIHPRTLSRRPGRSSAGSIMSGRLVAATTKTPARPSTPSISVSN